MTTCPRCHNQYNGFGLCPQCRHEVDHNKREDRITADKERLVRRQMQQFDQAQAEARAQAEGEATKSAFTARFIELTRYAKE